MATQILTRKQKGERISIYDIEQINPESYFVKSQTGKSGYSVTRAGKGWTYDCFDHKYRGQSCKHIYAVQNLAERLNTRFELSYKKTKIKQMTAKA